MIIEFAVSSWSAPRQTTIASRACNYLKISRQLPIVISTPLDTGPGMNVARPQLPDNLQPLQHQSELSTWPIILFIYASRQAALISINDYQHVSNTYSFFNNITLMSTCLLHTVKWTPLCRCHFASYYERMSTVLSILYPVSLSVQSHVWFFMAALCNREGHYIFALWFLPFFLFFLVLFFPRLISAAAD